MFICKRFNATLYCHHCTLNLENVRGRYDINGKIKYGVWYEEEFGVKEEIKPPKDYIMENTDKKIH